MVNAVAPSVALGLFDFKDFADFGPEPYVVRADSRVQTIAASGGAALSTALASLAASGGGDTPEAGWESLFSIASISPISVDGYVNPVMLPTPSPDETAGSLLGAGFRDGAARVVATVTSAEWHDAEGVPADGQGNGLNDYTGHLGVPSRAQAIAALTGAGIQTIGVVVAPSGLGNPLLQGRQLAQATGTIVTPSAFGPSSSRPPGCAAGQCCTGINGAGEAPAADGTCPLVVGVDVDGSGAASALVLGVQALVAGAAYDTYVLATDVDAGTVAAFLAETAPNLKGSGAASGCLALSADRVVGVAGQMGGLSHVGAGQRLCFDVVPRTNGTIASASTVRFFRARLQLKGAVGANTSIDLDTPRTIVFMVPPG